MISLLKGKIAEIGRNWIILDVSGVGYLVHMGDKALASLAKNTGILDVYTKVFFDQHEGVFQVFGFLKRGDLDFFDMLNSVSGIGPKKAMNIMSNAEFDDLVMAVAKNDPDYLSKITGLGTKTSQRLVMELKDRIRKAETVKYSGVDLTSEGEAIDALVSLGFNQKQAQEALKKTKSEGLENRVKEALKILSGRK